MPITLLAISPAELQVYADEKIPAQIAALADALPPAFVARRALDQLAAGKPLRWCSTFYMLRESDQMIVGSCGFKDAPSNARVEIGYAVSPACRKQGNASAAVSALLELAFAGGVHEVLAQVNPDNLASTRVLEKLGFRHAGVVSDEHGETLVQWIAVSALGKNS